MFPDVVRVRPDQMPKSNPEPGLTRLVVAYNDKIVPAEHHMEQGWIGIAHSHPHDQMAYVISGPPDSSRWIRKHSKWVPATHL